MIKEVFDFTRNLITRLATGKQEPIESSLILANQQCPHVNICRIALNGDCLRSHKPQHDFECVFAGVYQDMKKEGVSHG